MVEQQKLPFPILADEQRTLITALGLVHEGGGPDGGDIAIPAHVLVDDERQVRWKYVSDRIQNRQDPQRVLEQVRAALK